ncbi:hypothetical protein GCM10009804_31130 [Kribbella hippodromi]|uniref:Uncharacterized protein n=1 Tax=Kribbella hippodromi TaxID=434347 RepID=A0ABP4P6H5_9ACTN
MRRIWGIAVLTVVAVTGCGTEVASTDGAGRGPMGTPVLASPATPNTPMVPMQRTLVPPEVFEQLPALIRSKSPDQALPPSGATQAQVILSCAYEPNSPQDTTSGANRQNPPGEHRGPNRGDLLAPGTFANTAKYFTHDRTLVAALDFGAESYTDDAWPVRQVRTIFRVPKERVTRQDLISARNQYAKGCSGLNGWFDPRVVKVSVYAPWNLGF